MRVFKNKNIKYKKYICELFRISQCKTRNEFRKGQLSESSEKKTSF